MAEALMQKVRIIAAYSALSSARKLALGGSSDHSRPTARETSSSGRRRGIASSPATCVSKGVDTVLASMLFVFLASERQTSADANGLHAHGLSRGVGSRYGGRRRPVETIGSILNDQ